MSLEHDYESNKNACSFFGFHCISLCIYCGIPGGRPRDPAQFSLRTFCLCPCTRHPPHLSIPHFPRVPAEPLTSASWGHNPTPVGREGAYCTTDPFPPHGTERSGEFTPFSNLHLTMTTPPGFLGSDLDRTEAVLFGDVPQAPPALHLVHGRRATGWYPGGPGARHAAPPRPLPGGGPPA